MQRRGFVLVLALFGLARAQIRPGQTSAPPPPTIVIDMGSSLPIDARPGNTVHRSGFTDSASVSASDLAVPQRAHKELERGIQSLTRQNWTQARDRLRKAISLYPSYAVAYNNLAIAYGYLGEADQERQALEKAIALDDHLAVAHFNVGRMEIEQGRLAEAESALKLAVTLAPQDPRAFIVLGYCQLLQKHFDDAIETSQDAHKLLARHALAHYVAARAFEQKRQFDRAAAELSQLLHEEPAGSQAEGVRKELEMVQALLRK